MIPKQAYLIVDVGTGNVRVAVAEQDGNILGVESEDARYEKDLHYPESIYFSPDALWQQIIDLAKKIFEKTSPVNITAVTATSQREGIVVIDHTGNSLIGMPNIDHRGREWEDLIADKHGVYQLTGRYPTSLFSALKLVGLRNRIPETWQRVHTFMSISDWVLFKFSGVIGYEHSQACETLLYDVAAKGWSADLCKIFDLNPSLLAPLHDCGSLQGKILPEIAAIFGLSNNAVVIVAGSDTQLAIMSMCPSVQDIVVVSGTTTPVIKITGTYILDEAERTWTSRHTNGNNFLLEANAGVTGLNYQRLKEIFYPNEPYALIEEEVANIRDAQCVAALGSLLADEKSPLIRGGFVFNTPVSHELRRGHFVFATLWDIACSIFENYKSLCEVVPHEEDHIWACGGGVQSRLLRQFLANLLNKKVRIRDNYRQASAVGCVFACNQALGIASNMPAVLEEISPDQSMAHEHLYHEWKKTRATFKTAS
ncbi:FGGY-family carbohydrate kinase [Dyadobacter psychrophilus]|uniref:Autoinducer 2 (AI-2) kinase n=1 Tax=Dyadobacter psychrophilus TaxID=651661 RepID=A0A1T5ED38_9BACT|nr:FGGY family carbohydrate kinase [Dyadobacter psychrophilus]SKB82007.1 autoinducer 2 (AI-2) kinase [Dyadobacter psychrophilus]